MSQGGQIIQYLKNFSQNFQLVKPSTVVGLSIGTSSIKIVEMKKNKNQWKLLNFGLVQLNEDAIVNREIVNQIAVVDALKTLVKQIKPKNKNVCSAISGTGVIVKRMSVEVPNIKDLQDQVFWEAEQYLPFDISQVVMDYQLLSRSKDNECSVLLVAAKSDSIQVLMSCIEEAGLRPQVIDIDHFALQNTFEANYPTDPSEAVALVDIGASSLKIVVVHDGVPVFTKDSAMGGNHLTAEIQKHLNLSYEDAETLKVGSRDSIPQEVNELMQIAAENYASEIKRALDFYNASMGGASVSYLLLTGGGSRLPDLSALIEEEVRLPTQILNPFSSITYDPNVFSPEYMDAISSVASIPIGLAIRAGGKKQ